MDKYVKKKKIGEGSFGKALLVKSKADGKEYVIKEINISKLDTIVHIFGTMKRKEREESKKEVSVLRKMRHPNIVSYQESFEAEGNLYIVMDYCDGGDLYKAINGRRGVQFPEDQVVDWFVQICLALKHVHDRKILHRDIKSQNIFLTRKGIIKLGDFGIARVLNSTADLARTCIGTPYYLSPEICENKPYNNKSDVWALGCVLYEMCTLKHAFEAGNMKNLVLKIIRGSYPPLSPCYSYDLRTLQNQLFKRSPRDRPSISTILKKKFIQQRIEKFLSETQRLDEFSHTVLHRQAPAARAGGAGRPVVSAAKKPSPYQPARVSDPSAKYGPSVAARRPPSGGAKRSADREKKVQEVKELERKKKELIDKEQERRNREIQLRLQQQRLANKQRMHHIQKAREAGWKNTLLGSDEAANENDSKSNDEPPKKEPRIEAKQNNNKPLRERGNYDQYNDYLNKLQGNQQQAKPSLGGHAAFRNEDPEDAAIRQRINQRPVSASAADAAKRGEDARMKGAEAAERAKMVEEFLSRKREAAANRQRGQAQWMGGPVPNLQQAPAGPEVLLPYGGGPGGAMKAGKNAGEQEYLERLKAIRMQNYAERRGLQQKIAAGAGGKAVRASLDEHDPKSNADARRKKIEALKAQADQKAAKLKEQLEKQRREAYEKEKKQWEQHLARKQAAKHSEPRAGKPKGPAAPVIGLTGVLHDVGIDLPSAEPERITDVETKEPKANKEPEVGVNDHMKWKGGDTVLERLGNMPVQMETVIYKSKEELGFQEIGDRKHWKGGETAANQLAKLPVQENTNQEIGDRKQWKGGETVANQLSQLPVQENTSQVALDRRKWSGGETAVNQLTNLPVHMSSEVDRKKWAGGDTAITNLGKLPLQQTASGMEATSAQDLVIRNPDGTISTRAAAPAVVPVIGGAVAAANGGAGGRKKWGGGKSTAVVGALQKIDIASETITISKDKPQVPMGVTIVKSSDKETPPRKLPIAKGTITISTPDDKKSKDDTDSGTKGTLVISTPDDKKATDDTDAGDIETIDAGDGKSDEIKERLGTIGESTEPKTAWDGASSSKSPRPPKSPKSPTESATGSASSLELTADTAVRSRSRSPRSPRRRRELTKTEKKPTNEGSEETNEEEGDTKEEEKTLKKKGTDEKSEEDKKTKESSPEKKADDVGKDSQEQVSGKEKDVTQIKSEEQKRKNIAEDDDEEEQKSYLQALQQQLEDEIEDKSPAVAKHADSQEDLLEAYRDTFLELSGEMQPGTVKQILNQEDAATLKADAEVEALRPRSPAGDRRLSLIKETPSTPPSTPTEVWMNPDDKAVHPDQAVEALISSVELQDKEDREKNKDEDTPSKDESDDGGVFVGLTTGNFDTDARILRSCSMPDLSKLFRTTLAFNPFFEVEHQAMAAAATTLNLNLEVDDLEDEEDHLGADNIDGGAAGGVDGGEVVENGEDGEQNQPDDIEDEDDDDDEDFHSFVESLKHVLAAADKEDDEEAMDSGTPSPKSHSPTGAEGGDDDDEEDGNTSKPINEDWDSGSGTDDETPNQDDDDTESVYCRLEESRLQLEEELGCDDFVKAYKTVQAIHEDENENIEDGTKIIDNILGEEKQHLYTKILQLVMADGAYTEDND